MASARWLVFFSISWMLIGCAINDLARTEGSSVEVSPSRKFRSDQSSHEGFSQAPIDAAPFSFPDQDNAQPSLLARIPSPSMGSEWIDETSPAASHPDLGIDDHPRVEFFVDFFTEDARQNFERGLARAGKYLPVVREIFEKEGLPEPMIYIPLIESAFNIRAYSHRGAAGLWQFMPATARKFGLRVDWWVDERRDPVKSTTAAARYLKYLHDMFQAWDLAIAAYNAGEGTIEHCLRTTGEEDFWGIRDQKRLRRETKDFVPKFLAAYRIVTNLEEYGFEDIQYAPPLEFDTISISDPLDLKTIARLVNVTEEEIRELNPQLRRRCSPPGPGKTELRLPTGTAETFMADVVNVPSNERADVRIHRVKRGETLWGIARRYGSRVDLIQQFNRLPSAHRIRVGAALTVPLVQDGGSRNIQVSDGIDAEDESLFVEERISRPGSKDEDVVVHYVRRGDTLWSISRQYGVRIVDILRWNALGSHCIHPGDELKLLQKET